MILFFFFFWRTKKEADLGRDTVGAAAFARVGVRNGNVRGDNRHPGVEQLVDKPPAEETGMRGRDQDQSQKEFARL